MGKSNIKSTKNFEKLEDFTLTVEIYQWVNANAYIYNAVTGKVFDLVNSYVTQVKNLLQKRNYGG